MSDITIFTRVQTTLKNLRAKNGFQIVDLQRSYSYISYGNQWDIYSLKVGKRIRVDSFDHAFYSIERGDSSPLDSPKEDKNAPNESLKMVVPVVLGIRLKGHASENLERSEKEGGVSFIFWTVEIAVGTRIFFVNFTCMPMMA